MHNSIDKRFIQIVQRINYKPYYVAGEWRKWEKNGMMEDEYYEKQIKIIELATEFEWTNIAFM